MKRVTFLTALLIACLILSSCHSSQTQTDVYDVLINEEVRGLSHIDADNYGKFTMSGRQYVNDVEEIREIGFYKDLLKPLQTVLQYLPYSAIDRKGKKISELMMYLRNYLNRKMKEQGYSKRNLFFNMPKAKMLERNLLYIARKVQICEKKFVLCQCLSIK